MQLSVDVGHVIFFFFDNHIQIQYPSYGICLKLN